MKEEHVILVDAEDNAIGSGEKIATHKEGKLHRAFSIFLFNDAGEILMQRRAMKKYHSGGLWTNTCCGHPRPGENTEDAAQRRLEEEMGMKVPLREIDTFTYHVDFGTGLFEHEYDHVFIGQFNGPPTPNPDEVMDWKWMSVPDLRKALQDDRDQYTYWIKEALDLVCPVQTI